MTRRSITQRLEDRGQQLAGQPVAGTTTPVSPVHLATVQVLSDLLTLGRSMESDATPTHLRVLMRTIDKSRPMLLESIASIPPAQVKSFMADLAARIASIVDAPEEDAAHDSPVVVAAAADPVEDLATGT